MEEEFRISFQVKENRMALIAGILAIGFAAFILVMGICYPSVQGTKVFFYPLLLLMAGAGTVCCMAYHFRSLAVEQMDLCYVNFWGRKKKFTLDEIGYCKLIFYGNNDSIRLYDLRGEKLCKLEFNMRGAAEFLQYLLDNQVKTEMAEQTKQNLSGFGYTYNEKGICEEQIRRCAEEFYDKIGRVLADWEKQNRKFNAYWEYGLVEYGKGDLAQGRQEWKCRSSVQEAGECAPLPEDYACVLEAYLKRDNKYVMDKKGIAVGFFLPCIERTKSYRIGERLRLRKTDEEALMAYMAHRLELLTWELPRHRYHMKALTLEHELRRTAGITLR